MGEAEAHDALYKTLLRWSAEAASPSEVVEDAAEALGAGVEEGWVLALACLPSAASSDDVEDVIGATPPDLRVPLLPRRNPVALLAAVMVEVRRFADGHLTERELARWAHEVIGHGHGDDVERLVSLDDSYDTAEYFGDSIAVIDEQVRREVKRLLSAQDGQ